MPELSCERSQVTWSLGLPKKRLAQPKTGVIRDDLFGSPEEVGHEIIPIGETITVNGQPLTIIGMFQHYEIEQDRKYRVLQQQQGKTQEQTGVARSRGWGGGGRGGGVFRWKNSTVYIPLNKPATVPNKRRSCRISDFRQAPRRSYSHFFTEASPADEVSACEKRGGVGVRVGAG